LYIINIIRIFVENIKRNEIKKTKNIPSAP